MRDLRIGVFDVLVGINLLREGLDIQECALVGILDADKEGFLRSGTSLIQTIGRAARNLEGKVILYADNKTKSIEKAITETNRRRTKQLEYNKKNNINASSIKKDINDILESVYEKDYVKIGHNINIGGNLKKHLKILNTKMKDAAANLEFEEAAKIRDEIRKLEATELEINLNPKIKQYNIKNKLYPEGRSKIENETRDIAQSLLDEYESGIQITQVQTQKADPPDQVIDAFRDVQAARADMERSKNQAEGYQNDVIPRARGDAAKILQEAEAYQKQVVALAEGEASRFLAIYYEYAQAKQVTQERMYLETMEKVLADIDKVIIDRKAGGVVPYLPLPELGKKKKGTDTQ